MVAAIGEPSSHRTLVSSYPIEAWLFEMIQAVKGEDGVQTLEPAKGVARADRNSIIAADRIMNQIYG